MVVLVSLRASPTLSLVCRLSKDPPRPSFDHPTHFRYSNQPWYFPHSPITMGLASYEAVPPEARLPIPRDPGSATLRQNLRLDLTPLKLKTWYKNWRQVKTKSMPFRKEGDGHQFHRWPHYTRALAESILFSPDKFAKLQKS